QGIAAETRFADPIGAAKALGGLRSDFAARLRVKDFRPLDRLHRNGLLSKGLAIPEYWTYCSEDDLGLFKAAKGTRLTKDMKTVLKLIEEEGPISRQRLLVLSDLSRPSTATALRNLYEGLHVTRDADNRYRLVPDLNIGRVGQIGFRRKFVLTPMDNLFLYLREAIVAKFHMGYCYVVFDGPEMVAAFKARRRKWQLMVTEFQGDPAARRIVDLWESENELAVEEQVDRISDHEVMEWYAKMYGRGAADK